MGIDIKKPFRRKKPQQEKIQRIDLFATVLTEENRLHYGLLSNIIGEKDIALKQVIYNVNLTMDEYIKKYSPGMFFCVTEKTPAGGCTVGIVSSMEPGCSPKLMKMIGNNKNLELALTTLESKLFAGLGEDAAEPTAAYVKQ